MGFEIEIFTNRNMKKNLSLLLIALLVAGCTSQKENSIDLEDYKRGIEEWHANRVAQDLKGDRGWLNLAGLFWLNEGFNTFGSAPTNDLVFPEEKIASNAGVFSLQQGKVIMQVNTGVEIFQDTIAVNEIIVFDPAFERQPVLTHGSLEWSVIDRSGKLGVRLRDLDHEAVKNFEGVDRYEVDLRWRIEGRFEKYDDNRTIDITNILGQTYPQACPGVLVFDIDGKEFRLDAIDEGGDDYFIIFGDKTNEKETYPSGRYMYVSPPDESGKVIIDFNKSYNPPCAFTEFATCPLPPRQNVMDVAIYAGEKNYGTH